MKNKTDYKNILVTHLDKCFGNNIKGVLCISNENFDEQIPLYKDDKKYCVNQFSVPVIPIADAMMFNSMCNQVFDAKLTGCMIKMDTEQKINGQPVYELYGFHINQDGILTAIDSIAMQRADNTDPETGMLLPPRENVVYCDIEGNRIPSFYLI